MSCARNQWFRAHFLKLIFYAGREDATERCDLPRAIRLLPRFPFYALIPQLPLNQIQAVQRKASHLLFTYFTSKSFGSHAFPSVRVEYRVSGRLLTDVMKRSFVISLHIGFWACYLLLVFITVMLYYRSGLYASTRETRVVNALENIALFALLPSVISFYLYYFFLFPRYLKEKKFLLAVPVGLAISVVGATIAYLLHRNLIEAGHVIDMDEGGKNGRSTYRTVILVMTVIGAMCGAVALVIRGFITWFNEIKLKQILTEKNHEMEMALIKSQLDPHLLFNTINNIDTLILRDPLEASGYLNKLSDILRFVLYETTASKILLSQEIEYIEKYIALQKIRTANATYVNFSVTGTVGERRIAPMVFIPFIENAFKHTNNKKLENAITVSISINAETIQLVCENRYDSKSPKQLNGGLGNELVQKRLDLIYAGNYSLQVQKADEVYRVNLTVPNE